MGKFNVGDRVEVVATTYTWDSNLQNGEKGTVVEVVTLPSGNTVNVVLTDNGYKPVKFGFEDPYREGWAFYDKELKVIK